MLIGSRADIKHVCKHVREPDINKKVFKDNGAHKEKQANEPN